MNFGARRHNKTLTESWCCESLRDLYTVAHLGKNVWQLLVFVCNAECAMLCASTTNNYEAGLCKNCSMHNGEGVSMSG